MGRLTGLFFKRKEFVGALRRAVEEQLELTVTKAQGESILDMIVDEIDGLDDIFEANDEEDEDESEADLEEVSW